MTTPTRIIRPDVRQPDQYQMFLSESMLLWLEGGVLTKAADLHRDIARHGNCDMLAEDGCLVRREWIASKYGTLEAGLADGCRLTDCSEDLMFLHTSLGELMDVITQSRYIRNNPTKRSYHDVPDAQAKLVALKGEVAYREQQATVPTGHMERLTDEKLAELDRQNGKEQDETRLLDLVEGNKGSKPAVKTTKA